MILDKHSNENIKVFFTYSAIQEMTISLHVMANPSHHLYTKDWAVNKFQNLSVDLQRDIQFFAENYADWFFVIDVVNSIVEKEYPRKMSVNDVLDEMMRMDEYLFAKLFLGLTVFEYDEKMLHRWMKEPDSVTEQELGAQSSFLSLDSAKAFLKDIGGTKIRLKNTLQRYWDECFKEEWKSIEPYLESVERREELKIQDENYMDYINDLHPDLLITDEEIVFRKDPPYAVPIKKIKKLVIILSVFSTPHLSGNFVGDTLDISKNLNFHSVKVNEEIPSELYSVLYACSDATRLKIIKILWNSDATTTDIAEILELSPSTVSIHLKVLRDANLVETNKIKKYVHYSIKKEPFLNLQERMSGYFTY